MSEIKPGTTVRIINDWIDSDAKSHRCVVDKLQNNGKMIFAKVRWVGRDTKDYPEKYGVLFPLDELRTLK